MDLLSIWRYTVLLWRDSGSRRQSHAHAHVILPVGFEYLWLPEIAVEAQFIRFNLGFWIVRWLFIIHGFTILIIERFGRRSASKRASNESKRSMLSIMSTRWFGYVCTLIVCSENILSSQRALPGVLVNVVFKCQVYIQVYILLAPLGFFMPFLIVEQVSLLELRTTIGVLFN